MDITPLRVSRDFRSLFIAHSVSFVGDEIIAVVVPYQVFKITGSTFAVGMLGLVTLVPVFVFPIIGGAAADAMERRGLIVTTYAILAALSLAMAWNAARPTPLLWPLYVFSFFSAGLYTFNRPALDTWPARLLEPDLLPSSNALEAGFGTAAMMVGPLTAGIMLATVGAATAYVVDAGTFLFAIAMIWRMRPSPPSDEENEISWEAIKDGFRFLRGKRNVQAVFLADLNAMTFGWPMALMPAVALTIGGAGHQEQVLGLLFAAPAVGSFLTTVFSGRAKDVRRQGRTILVANIVWGAAIALFGLVHTLWARPAPSGRRQRRRYGERDLPLLDPAGRRRGPLPGEARRDREGRLRDRSIAWRGGILCGRLARRCARGDRLGRARDDRGRRRDPVVRARLLAPRRAPPDALTTGADALLACASVPPSRHCASRHPALVERCAAGARRDDGRQRVAPHDEPIRGRGRREPAGPQRRRDRVERPARVRSLRRGEP
jgi:MFS family permease